MKKDFNTWNHIKQKIDARLIKVFAHPREIWWCSLGINIGAEIDGKNDNFERPVLIIKIFNKETLLILPLTTKNKDDEFHYKITTETHESWAKLTQPRVISSKRLLRKITTLNETIFIDLKTKWKNSL
jgi:mRNA interferase MazF